MYLVGLHIYYKMIHRPYSVKLSTDLSKSDYQVLRLFASRSKVAIAYLCKCEDDNGFCLELHVVFKHVTSQNFQIRIQCCCGNTVGSLGGIQC